MDDIVFSISFWGKGREALTIIILLEVHREAPSKIWTQILWLLATRCENQDKSDSLLSHLNGMFSKKFTQDTKFNLNVSFCSFAFFSFPKIEIFSWIIWNSWGFSTFTKQNLVTLLIYCIIDTLLIEELSCCRLH